MANNISWWDTKGNLQLTQPFLCYVGRTYSKYYADWLFGIKDMVDFKGKNPRKGPDGKPISKKYYYSSRFGQKEPKNLVDEALKTNKVNNFFGKKKDKTILDGLIRFKEELEQEERTLYRDVGCKNFEQFKKMWYGEQSFKKKQTDEERKNYWLNFHLDLFAGETQRLIIQSYSKFTPIEEVLQLCAIELDQINMSGIEGKDGRNKKKMKDELLGQGYLEIVHEKFKSGGEGDVYVPTGKSSDGSDKSFLENIKKFYAEKAGLKTAEILKKEIGNDLNRAMVYAIGQIEKKIERDTKAKKTTALKRMFVGVDFVGATRSASAINDLVKALEIYLAKARNFIMTDKQIQLWEADNKGGRMTKYINKQLEILVKSYFSTRDMVNFASSGKIELGIMGFLGELATYGKAYFNLSNKSVSKIDVFDVGDFLSKGTGQKIGTDTILVINGNSYGIQVKNPYQVNEGYYKTYDTKNMNFKDKANQIAELLGMDDEQWNLFEMYNLNINNAVNSQYLLNRLKDFLYLYSDQFARLEDYEIKDDLSKYHNSVLSSLQNKKIHNVFFVLKGEILPSSLILDGLIKQYQYFMNYWDKDKTTDFSTVVINYTNTIQKNVIPGGLAAERASYESLGYQYVHTGSNLLEDLSRIKIRAYLQLQIPSIASLTFLK